MECLHKKTWYADAWKEVRSYSKKINYKIVSTNITRSNVTLNQAKLKK